MALLSLKRYRSVDPERTLNLRACGFKRTLMRGGLVEGGVLTCRCPDGREWSLTVGMSWDVLGVLRGELERCGVHEADETILREVLRFWGIEEFSQRLIAGADLPSEGLILDELGGPAGCRSGRLLQACGLLPPDAA
jgi:hypothetical protein